MVIGTAAWKGTSACDHLPIAEMNDRRMPRGQRQQARRGPEREARGVWLIQAPGESGCRVRELGFGPRVIGALAQGTFFRSFHGPFLFDTGYRPHNVATN